LKKKMLEAIPVYKKYLPMLNLEIVPMPSAQELRNPSAGISDKDIPVFVSACNANADFFVTGDKKGRRTSVG